MQCPRCGSTLPDDAYQCPVCTAFVRTVPAQARTQAVPPTASGYAGQAPPNVGRSGTTAPPPGYAVAYPQQPTVQQTRPATASVVVAHGRGAGARTGNTIVIVAAAVMLLGLVGGIVWFVRSKPIYPLTTRMRLLETGDKFTYKVLIEMRLPPELDAFGNGGAHKMNGLLTKEVISTTLGDRPVLAITSRSSLDDLFFSLAGRTYFHQDPATREMVALAKARGSEILHHVVQCEGDDIGVFNTNRSAGRRYIFDNGEVEEETARVTGIETVETSLGRFTAWRVEGADVLTTSDTSNVMTQALGLNQNQTTQITEWIVPQLGAAVQRDEEVEGGLFPSIKIHMTLDSTSIPLR